MKNIEVLAPAGSYEMMLAAYNSGADAVYIGGDLFGARAYAKNLDTKALLEAVDYSHLHHKRLYLTVNTLLKDREIAEKLIAYLKPFYENGLDAVIVQDYGVLNLIHEYFPDMHIHASTQMTLTSSQSGVHLKELGVTRIVTPRELNVDEIHQMKKDTGLEIESFVHGALCYCYSGQCLMSSVLGGRSGNRGRCAQPCRLPYSYIPQDGKKIAQKEKYLLSPKDLCYLDVIPEMVEAGVDSFKIEGRMKKPEYAAMNAGLYRKYLDLYLEKGRDGFKIDKADKKLLNEIYNRGGFTHGYLHQRNDASMISVERPHYKTDEEMLLSIGVDTSDKVLKEKINGEVTAKLGEPLTLTIDDENHHVEVQGEVVTEANNRPLTKEDLQKRMKKTGNTPYEFAKINAVVEDGAYVSIQGQNQVKREALEQLEAMTLHQYRRTFEEHSLEVPEFEKHPQKTMGLHVLIEQPAMLAQVLSYEAVDRLYIAVHDMKAEKIQTDISKVKAAGKEAYVALPYMYRDTYKKGLSEVLKACEKAGVDGYLVRNPETFWLIKELDLTGSCVLDYNVYTFNKFSKAYWLSQGADVVTLPVELNYGELRHLGGEQSEFLAYGHIPLMTSAQCLLKTTGRCSHQPGFSTLVDRYKKPFYVWNECAFCYNLIYNGVPMMLLDARDQIEKLNPESIRLNFVKERPEEIGAVLEAFIKSFKEGIAVENPLAEYTRGHFKRGIE